ncbi:Bromodomain-containing protein [Infundibulicybe gibba]|nr:Bromodomain-containing protein [Infundibulicybe gibba]
MNDVLSTRDPGHADQPIGGDVPNGVHDTELIINGGVNGHKPPSDGDGTNSPSASPSTPISTVILADVKIDIDHQEQESDVRHEPLPLKTIDAPASVDDASVVPEPGTPLDPSMLSFGSVSSPDSIPTHPPSGTPPPPEQVLEDVKMTEVITPASNGINGDIVMADAEVRSPATSPGLPADSPMESNPPSTSHTSPNDLPTQEDDEVKPPPAKRARMFSDADKASLSHSATPPPASAIVSNGSTPVPPSTAGPSTLSTAQFRFCLSTVRSLKKLKDATPFLRPVDPIALNIPHYPSIIKTPMDFSTVEHKLTSSNPSKPDTNPQNPRYRNADEFISDVRLIFQNCLTFNGPDHAIALMGKRVEEVFDKQIKQMPLAPVEPKPPIIKKSATPPPPPPPVAPPKKSQPVRRASTSVPVIRRSDTETIGRPKREIHPPPPKDLPYADAPKKHRKGKRVKDDGTLEQLKFCSKILHDLNRKQHYAVAHPFYEPVDWVKLELPSYPKLIKKPMDLSTIRKKLDNHEYPTAQKFFDDFKLMIRNCFHFNPAGTPVNQAGIELQRLFDEKWKNLPVLHEVSDDDPEEEEEDSEEERQPFAGTIAMMESQIETMRGSIAALKGAKQPKEKKKIKEKREKAPVASTSKPPTKPKALPKKKGKKPIADDDVLTFEQKKDLSESIGKLDGTKLEKVIHIIHEGVPEIRDSTEEIELEIDLLPAAVLTKLYNFVLRPLRTPAVKRSRPGKGTGTGGLKRKSMDEDVEAEKIRQLEERMALFEKGPGSAPPPVRKEHESDHSSDSSSGSDSSGSDSE